MMEKKGMVEFTMLVSIVLVIILAAIVSFVFFPKIKSNADAITSLGSRTSIEKENMREYIIAKLQQNKKDDSGYDDTLELIDEFIKKYPDSNEVHEMHYFRFYIRMKQEDYDEASKAVQIYRDRFKDEFDSYYRNLPYEKESFFFSNFIKFYFDKEGSISAGISQLDNMQKDKHLKWNKVEEYDFKVTHEELEHFYTKLIIKDALTCNNGAIKLLLLFNHEVFYNNIALPNLNELYNSITKLNNKCEKQYTVSVIELLDEKIYYFIDDEIIFDEFIENIYSSYNKEIIDYKNIISSLIKLQKIINSHNDINNKVNDFILLNNQIKSNNYDIDSEYYYLNSYIKSLISIRYIDYYLKSNCRSDINKLYDVFNINGNISKIKKNEENSCFFNQNLKSIISESNSELSNSFFRLNSSNNIDESWKKNHLSQLIPFYLQMKLLDDILNKNYDFRRTNLAIKKLESMNLLSYNINFNVNRDNYNIINTKKLYYNLFKKVIRFNIKEQDTYSLDNFYFLGMDLENNPYDKNTDYIIKKMKEKINTFTNSENNVYYHNIKDETENTISLRFDNPSSKTKWKMIIKEIRGSNEIICGGSDINNQNKCDYGNMLTIYDNTSVFIPENGLRHFFINFTPNSVPNNVYSKIVPLIAEFCPTDDNGFCENGNNNIRHKIILEINNNNGGT